MSRSPSIDLPLYSSLGGDPDLAEIVEMFVDEMADRIDAMLSSLESGELESLRRTVHQLKGAAGSHGFEPVSEVAGRVEDAIRAADPLESIRDGVEQLVDLCRSCRAGEEADAPGQTPVR